ncbi:hypothetical protein ACIOZM_01700 [Pseudomonas sp. NPDC087346]|uniref:hypothetical protein n=1 Tax=Pseudomonas sp. NPDC087346 TaxID=3364438 RepID=UPI00380D8210
MEMQEFLELARNDETTGTFTAEVDGRQFLDATTVTFYHHEKAFIVHASDNTGGGVVFDFPADTVGDETHTVHFPASMLLLKWYAKFKPEHEDYSEINDLRAGSAKFYLSDDRKHVYGEIDFVLWRERRVTGKFDLVRK